MNLLTRIWGLLFSSGTELLTEYPVMSPVYLEVLTPDTEGRLETVSGLRCSNKRNQ